MAKKKKDDLTPQQISEELFRTLDWVGCNPTNQTFFRKCLWFFNLCAMLFWFIMLILYNYCCFSGLAALSENIMYIAIVLQVLIKFFICRQHADKLSYLLEILFIDFWHLKDLSGVVRNKYKFLIKWLGITIMSYKKLFIFGVTAIILETLHTNPTKPVTNTYRPPSIDINNEQPYAIIIMVSQLGSVCGCVILTLVPYDSIFILLVGSAYIQLVCIDLTLRTLVCNPERVDDAKASLAKCVKHHNLILTYLKKVEELYSLSLMCQLCALLLTICLSLYLVSSENISKARPILYAALSLAQLFCYCFGGQIITDQSLAISDAAYSCNWWKITDKYFRGGIILIIQRSHKIVQISAGNLFVLSMDLFMTVLRSCGSFVTLLQSMQE